VPSIATVFAIVFIFLISFYTPLLVSALMGHLQEEHRQSLMEAITPTTDPSLGYTVYSYNCNYKLIKKFKKFKIVITPLTGLGSTQGQIKHRRRADLYSCR
jgi:hypothetical protein